jgi:nucleoside-diphosphate-sugar epimerase
VGSRLLRELGVQGWRRRCLVHRRPVGDTEETLTGDLADPSSLHDAVDGVTAVAHLAAVTHSRSPGQYFKVNVRGTQNLLDAALAGDVRRFLFLSTRAISPDGGAYSRSKHLAEQAVRACALEWTIVRMPELYGVGNSEGVDRIIARARHGGRIPVVGRGDDVLCPVHVDDAVPACARALEAPEAVRYTYTLAGACLTMRELVSLAADSFGRRPRVIRIPVPAVAVLGTLARVAPIPVYPDQLARLRSPKPPLSPKAEADLLFRSRPLHDGLAEVATRDG